MTKCRDERGSGCRRVSRCIYTEHSDIRCVSSPERFLKWIIVLCVEAGSHYELTGSEQNRRGSVQAVLTLLKWLQKHVQYFQTQETLPPCVSYTSPSLWDLNHPYSYARARLFGSDSSSKATKDIYFSGVPKYKYKAFNSSAASPDRRCTSHNPTSNQPDWLDVSASTIWSWNSFKLLHPAATKPRRRDSEGFQWETFNWNIELKQIESTLLDTSSP